MNRNILVPLLLVALSACTMETTTDTPELITDQEAQVEEVEDSEPTDAMQEDALPHCVIETSAFSVDGTKPDAASTQRDPQCFRTFAEAIDFASAGRVRLPPGATVADVDADTFVPMQTSPLAAYVIGIEYNRRDYKGASIAFTSNVSCNGFDHYVDVMPPGWDNRTTSALTGGGCSHSYHYEHTYGGGAVKDCFTACSYVGGALNNRTSSIKWTQ